MSSRRAAPPRRRSSATLVAAAERQAQRRAPEAAAQVVLHGRGRAARARGRGLDGGHGILRERRPAPLGGRDERLQGATPGTRAVAGAAGSSRATWPAGGPGSSAGHRVTGFTAAERELLLPVRRRDGRLSRRRTGSRAAPRSVVMTDNAPGTLRVYGLAMDGVTAVSLRARGVTRRAVVGRNAFYLEANALGNRSGIHRHADRALPGRRRAARPVPDRRPRRRTPRLLPRTARPHAGREHGGLAAAVRGPVRRSGGAGPGASYSRPDRVLKSPPLLSDASPRGRSSMVERRPSKPLMRVRFPPPASAEAAIARPDEASNSARAGTTCDGTRPHNAHHDRQGIGRLPRARLDARERRAAVLERHLRLEAGGAAGRVPPQGARRHRDDRGSDRRPRCTA